MTFSLTKVLATLLAIAQFQNSNPDIVRSYDPARPEVMAADLSKGCRAMFSDDKFFTAKEIDELVTNLRAQQSQITSDTPDAGPEVSTDDAKNPPIALQIQSPAEPAAKNESSSVPAAIADGDSEISDAGDRNNNDQALSDVEGPAGADATLAATNPNLAGMLSGLKLFKDMTFPQALDVWDGVCRETIDLSKVPFINWSELATQYNAAVTALPDYKFLKGYRLPETSYIYDSKGNFIRELFEAEGHRAWVSLKDIPEHVRQAFISAEDSGFRSHTGIEPRGVLRGFLKYMKSKKIEGGSTITQQVIKNLVVGNDVSLDRKIKEMLLAKLVEKYLTKDEILELYLNLVNLGRGSWGVEMAARNYFAKTVKELDVAEAAFLAGTTHSPNRYEPTRHPERVNERVRFVINRMLDDKAISAEVGQTALAENLLSRFIEDSREGSGGHYFVQAVNSFMRERLDKNLVKKGGLRVRTTMIPELQQLVQGSLQEGLFEYERSYGRLRWNGPADRIDLSKNRNWAVALDQVRQNFNDITWDFAVVLERAKKGFVIGLINGSRVNLGAAKAGWMGSAYKQLKEGDVIFVKADEKGRYELRTAPSVQGAVVAMEPSTGRVLALAGGFSASYSTNENASDQFNRALNGLRQPGSTIKPFTYLAALQAGLQPNTLIPNRAIYFPRVRENKVLKCQSWNPGNYKSGGPSILTMRRGLETSNNRVTAQLLNQIVPENFMQGLDLVRDVTKDFGIYDNPFHCVSFILGADETTPLRMTTAYAAIANGGTRVSPKFIEVIADMEGQKISANDVPARPLSTVDATSLYQVRSILEGVLERGTAVRMKDLAHIVAGKTGTSNNQRDAWFVGFTKDIVIGVWVGYDSGANLGHEATGGRVALPIFNKIIRPSFDIYRPQTAFAPPPGSVQLLPTSVMCGDVVSDQPSDNLEVGFINEAFRRGSLDTQFTLVPYSPCGNGRRSSNADRPFPDLENERVAPSQQDSADGGAEGLAIFGGKKENAKKKKTKPEKSNTTSRSTSDGNGSDSSVDSKDSGSKESYQDRYRKRKKKKDGFTIFGPLFGN